MVLWWPREILMAFLHLLIVLVNWLRDLFQTQNVLDELGSQGLWLTHSFNIREAQFKYRVLICMDKWEKWCGVSECPTSHTLSLFAQKFTWTWFYFTVEGCSLNICWLKAGWPSYNGCVQVLMCCSKECVHLLDYQWQCHIDRPNKSKLT